jgi:hypothetical protein
MRDELSQRVEVPAICSHLVAYRESVQKRVNELLIEGE